MKVTRFVFNISPILRRYIDWKSNQTGQSRAAIVRQAVEKYAVAQGESLYFKNQQMQDENYEDIDELADLENEDLEILDLTLDYDNLPLPEFSP